MLSRVDRPTALLDLLDDFTAYMLQSTPVRRQATPGRDEPRPCGSGK